VTAPGVTFVVPTRNSARTLAACLRSIRGQTIPVELIVVDNHSMDGTQEIAAAHADLLIVAGPERSAQRNVGAAAASGDWLVFVDSDMDVHPQVAAQIVGCSDPALDALVLPETVETEGYWGRCRQLEKRAYLGDDAIEAARVFRRTAFETAGGYDEAMFGAEDWELPDRLRAAGSRIGRISSGVTHDEEGMSLRVTFSKKRYYGRTAGRYVTRAGRTSSRRRIFRPSLIRYAAREAPKHPAEVAGLVVLKSVEFLGIAVGTLEGARVRQP
jgi:glycosyltransferase involved in cell wall biosynthesis